MYLLHVWVALLWFGCFSMRFASLWLPAEIVAVAFAVFCEQLIKQKHAHACGYAHHLLLHLTNPVAAQNNVYDRTPYALVFVDPTVKVHFRPHKQTPTAPEPFRCIP